MPFHQNPHFPWKLFWKFLIKALVLFALVLLASHFVLRGLFLNDLQTQFPEVDWLVFLNLLLLVVAGSSFVIFIGLLTFVYFELLGPFGMFLGRVKTLNIQKSEDDLDETELSYEEPGEWSAMEAVIRQVQSEIRSSQSGSDRNRLSLSTLLTSLREGIVAYDSALKPLFFNEAFLNIFAVTRERFSGASLIEVIRDAAVVSAMERAIADNQVQVVELHRPGIGGSSVRNFRVTVSPLKEPEGPRFGVVAIFQDVTELKRLEQVRIDFVANVSHELRTPLTAVKGYTQTAIQDIESGKAEQVLPFLVIAQKNADRLLALVNDLLELSSLDAGVALEKSKVETKSASQSVLNQLEDRIRSKGIQVETRFGAATVVADESRLGQVLLNLVQNAIQYGREAGRVQIEWKPVEAGVELHVKDDGPGIEGIHQSRIFERFYRVDKARSRESGGTGLGLSIVKHIMQVHGGNVRVVSSPGAGAEFICLFPNGKESAAW